MPRVLGLDFGEKRIGLAVSDPMRALALPCEVWDVQRGDLLERIARLCREQDIREIVVGMPLNMNGTPGPQAERTKRFVEQLRSALPDLSVVTWDERLSSRAVERTLIEAGASRRRRRQVLDKLAAQITLQSYLDACAMRGGSHK